MFPLYPNLFGWLVENGPFQKNKLDRCLSEILLVFKSRIAIVRAFLTSLYHKFSPSFANSVQVHHV